MFSEKICPIYKAAMISRGRRFLEFTSIRCDRTECEWWVGNNCAKAVEAKAKQQLVEIELQRGFKKFYTLPADRVIPKEG